MSEVVPFLRLNVHVVDPESEDLTALVRTIESHELVEAVGSSLGLNMEAGEGTDVLFVNLFERGMPEGELSSSIRDVQARHPSTQVLLFAWADPLKPLSKNVAGELREAQVLELSTDPGLLAPQVDRALRAAWTVRFGAVPTRGEGEAAAIPVEAAAAGRKAPRARTKRSSGRGESSGAEHPGSAAGTEADPGSASVAAEVAERASEDGPAALEAAERRPADVPAGGPAEEVHPTGAPPLSASARRALRNAIAFHRAATRDMPVSIALMAGIAVSAESRMRPDTAVTLQAYLRERRPQVTDVELLGLAEYGIHHHPPPIAANARLEVQGAGASAELLRIIQKAGEYARRVHPDPAREAPSLTTSARHLLAALVTDEEPRFAVPGHLAGYGYSPSELRAELFRFFSSLQERTDAWREILRPWDALVRPPSPSAVPPAAQAIDPTLDSEFDPSNRYVPRLSINLLRNRFGQVAGEEGEDEDPDIVPPAGPRALRFAEEAPAAAYQSDEAAGRDLLNLKAEVNALSAVLASKDLRPPLSVGLFGDWGTGKSFFMGLMRTRIRQLSHDARHGRTEAFCPRIVQITFNAWHYMDANLWASLVSGVFDGLARSLSTDQERPAAVRERLLARLAENHAVLAQAEQRKVAADEATRRARDKLDQVEREKSGLRAVLGSGRDVIGVAVRQPEVTAQLVGLARQVGLPESTVVNIGAHQVKLDSGWEQVKVVWRIVTGREGDRRHLLLTALFGVLIVGLGVGAWLIARALFERAEVIAPVVAVLVGLATHFMTQLRPLYRKLRDAAPRLREIVQQAEGLARLAAQRMDHPAEEARRRLDDLEDEEAAVRQAHADAVRRVQEVDEEIQEIRAGRRLHRFISERSAAQDYRQHLGIVALVRDDFQRLSRLLREARTGADGELPPVDRIILYIDDLDRCPETRVVEVLQAVHLLLAFPLFVVVVGVDPRWLLRSVQNHYAQLVAGDADGPAEVDNPEEWASTPQNYLEKIFQIPFTLRPMESDEYASLIHGLVPLPGDPEYGKAAADEASRDDDEWLDFLEDAAPGPVGTAPSAVVRPGADPGEGADDPVISGRGSLLAAASAPGSAPAAVPETAVRAAGADGSRGPEESAAPRQESIPAGTVPSVEAPPLTADTETSPAPSAEGGQGTADEPAPGDAAAESTAQAAVRAAEQGLAMELHERAFLQTLAPLIPSPRSAKRLVNVYRFIRASLDPAELGSFAGPGPGSGDHRPVALLLAIVTGFPTQAVDLFRALEAEPAEGAQTGWWTFVEALAPREVDAGKWAQLQQALAHMKKTAPDLPLEPFVRWAPHVARFSFQTGQLVARRHG